MLEVIVARKSPGGSIEQTIDHLCRAGESFPVVVEGVEGVHYHCRLRKMEMMANALGGAAIWATTEEGKSESSSEPNSLIICKPLIVIGRSITTVEDRNRLYLVATGVIIDLIVAKLSAGETTWVEARPQDDGTMTLAVNIMAGFADTADWLSIPDYLTTFFLNRVKVMAEIPLAEKSSMQQGTILIPDESFPHLDIETAPTPFGETVRFS